MFYSEIFPKSSAAPAAARDLLDRLRDRLPESMFEDARLLVSEVVANAVEHVAEDGDIEVKVDFEETRLRIEVLDPGPGFTYVPRSDGAGSNDRGWGLVFIDRVSTRWANERGRVWFELGS
jgi:anti-sigma regulatory factor (Ser/Thr protein kinase)